MSRDNQIEHFWRWFASTADELAGCEDYDDRLAELDRRVSELGDVSWEIGPGVVEEHALVISPDGDRERLATTRAIVAAAPRVQGWELHPAKPPKQWARLRLTLGLGDAALEVDAEGWRYVMLRYPHGAHELLVEVPNLDGASEEDRYRAAVLVVHGLLGEERALEVFESIDVIERFEPERDAVARPIRQLPQKLRRGNGPGPWD